MSIPVKLLRNGMKKQRETFFFGLLDAAFTQLTEYSIQLFLVCYKRSSAACEFDRTKSEHVVSRSD